MDKKEKVIPKHFLTSCSKDIENLKQSLSGELEDMTNLKRELAALLAKEEDFNKMTYNQILKFIEDELKDYN